MAKFNFEIGVKVQSLDKDGYYIMNASGFIAAILGDGHAIIKTFSGEFYSTIGIGNIHNVEVVK